MAVIHYTGSKKRVMQSPLRRLALLICLPLLLAACQADEFYYSSNKAHAPVSRAVKKKMNQMSMSASSPIMIRIFKEESTLEVWKQKRNGRFALLESFEICKWSGGLGPKFKEGDRQAPEGFYEITPGLMNPNSNYHLAFNMGYPNTFDRAHRRTGSNLMVHGACSSRGCYAMTDAQVQDIYALARDSFKGGQTSFQVQAFPFRMTPENMARHYASKHIEFWKMLKTGYDHFEVTRIPPKVSVCQKKYVFNATPLVSGMPFRAQSKCPSYQVPASIAQRLALKQAKDQKIYAEKVARFKERDDRKRAQEQTEKQEELLKKEAEKQKALAEAEAQKTAKAAAKQAVTTSDQDRSGSFFSRLLSFEEDNSPSPEVGHINTKARPAAKP